MHDLRNPRIIEAPKRLILVFEEGRILEYRNRAGHLEYSANLGGPWIHLTSEQTRQHLVLHTVVGDWLKNRMDGKRIAPEERAA
jgi:hypothetical protein